MAMARTIVFSFSIFCYTISSLHLHLMYLGLINFGCLVAFNKCCASKKYTEFHSKFYKYWDSSNWACLDLNPSEVIEWALTETNDLGSRGGGIGLGGGCPFFLNQIKNTIHYHTCVNFSLAVTNAQARML